MKTSLAIVTSGGDAPGMNAAIRAATVVGMARGRQVLGVRHGFRGLIAGDFEPLDTERVAPILREGGTILGSARSPAFHSVEGRREARRALAEAGVTELVVIGGDGSLTGARALVDPDELGDQDLRVVGVPASIDNDIGLTGLAIGVDTAMNTIVDAADKIADTASAFDRTFIVEVMGRRCGYLAMTAGIAAGADLVLFPEAQHSADELVELVLRAAVRASQRPGRRRALVIKAEGTPLSPEELKARVDERLASGEFGSIGPIETRVTVLGHIVRGGRPSAFDRLLASRMARVAVEALAAGANRKMVAWMLPVPLPESIAERTPWDPYCFLVDLDAVLEETRSLRDATSELSQWRRAVFDDIRDVLTM